DRLAPFWFTHRLTSATLDTILPAPDVSGARRELHPGCRHGALRQAKVSTCLQTQEHIPIEQPLYAAARYGAKLRAVPARGEPVAPVEADAGAGVGNQPQHVPPVHEPGAEADRPRRATARLRRYFGVGLERMKRRQDL